MDSIPQKASPTLLSDPGQFDMRAPFVEASKRWAEAQEDDAGEQDAQKEV